jgi:antitoxin YefM
MTIVNVTEARSKLYNLIDEISENHEPIIITGKRSNAVLVSEEDWNAISETLYLLSIPKMRKSIKNGMSESVSNCSDKLDW